MAQQKGKQGRSKIRTLKGEGCATQTQEGAEEKNSGTKVRRRKTKVLR